MKILDLFKYYSIKVENDGPGRHRAICPLHEDNDPSLKIYSSTNTWWCFGCFSGSKPVDFVMQKEKCSYFEALSILSRFESNGVDALKKKVSEFRKKANKVANKGDRLRLKLNRICKKLMHRGKLELVNKAFRYCDEGRDITKTAEALRKLSKINA